MPQSDPYNIPWTIQLIKHINPASILDIGVGNGTYGFLLRQYLDITFGRLKKEQWIVTIDGIEIFEEYRNPVWAYFYNKILIGDAYELKDNILKYDVVLLGDVIEHFSKDEGLRLIHTLAEKSRYIVISTPKKYYPQGEVFGNVNETHLSEWGISDFSQFKVKAVILNTCNLFVLCKNKQDIQKVDLSNFPHLVKPGITLRGLGKYLAHEFFSDLRLSLELKKSKYS